ncbi:3-oxoacyl-[acyl-carrier-protein] reductase [Campylobacterota bacterium]|nr:3-oxoacyl-[acyl-carrier-protein] reductase [Campylobacterota bacterium]
MNFSGQNVLITGASKGIGREIAKQLAANGLKVWINYRSGAAEADELKAALESEGGKAAVIGFDATDDNAFADAVRTIADTDGSLAYLVNNAGITIDRLAIRMKTEEFMQVIDANLKSCFIGCREALKTMSKSRFGAVVNVASIVGEMGNAGQSNYAASKGGMIALTKSFAREGASRNVRFNSVAPGFIATAMTAVLSEEVKQTYAKNIPLGRFGEAKEVAEAIAFLLSDHSSYITGETLKINGGLYM